MFPSTPVTNNSGLYILLLMRTTSTNEVRPTSTVTKIQNIDSGPSSLVTGVGRPTMAGRNSHNQVRYDIILLLQAMTNTFTLLYTYGTRNAFKYSNI